MKEFLRSLWCSIFHTKKDAGIPPFTDVVSGKKVNYYYCINCKKTYMANAPHDFFKVYTETK